MKSNNQLFGRLLALDRLQEETFNVISPNFSPVILVHGISGVGKTALCEHFLNLIRHQLIGVGEVIIISYKGIPQSSSAGAFSRLLLESIKHSRARTVNPTRVADASTIRRFETISGMDKPYISELYSEDGAAYSDALSNDFLSDGEEIELAHDFVHHLSHLIETDYFMFGAEVRPRIVFYFDQFTRYPENLKRWVGDALYKAFELLKQSTVISGSAYLQTGPLAWEQADEADSWKVHPAALRQLELLRLSFCDCQQWLSELGYLDRDLVESLYEETEGVPAQIKAVLAQENFLSRLSNSSTLGRMEPLSQFSPRQRRWLHAAAMQVECSREALQILIGKAETQDAIDWFQQDPKLSDRTHKSVKSADEWSIRLNSTLRKEILNLAKKRKPLCHAGYQDKIELLHALNKQVPSLRHRSLLSQLSPIQPFSDKVLNEVFGP